LIRKLINILFKEKGRLLKFALVGLGGTAVNLTLVWLGNNFFFARYSEWFKTTAALALAIVASIFSNYVFNYIWTWQDRREKGAFSFALHLGKYYLASLAAALLQFIIAGGISFVLQVTLFAGAEAVPLLWKMGASFTGIGVAMFVNFLMNNYWTFKQQKPDLK
jgi:putative flippase GtrA